VPDRVAVPVFMLVTPDRLATVPVMLVVARKIAVALLIVVVKPDRRLPGDVIVPDRVAIPVFMLVAPDRLAVPVMLAVVPGKIGCCTVYRCGQTQHVRLLSKTLLGYMSSFSDSCAGGTKTTQTTTNGIESR
jgi:hypothetical protein